MRLLQARRLSRMGEAATGLEKQEEAAVRYAEIHGHEIVAVADDTNVSGSRDPFTRPKLGAWLADPSSYDGIIAAKLDRFGRNARHLQELRSWADDHGKMLFVVEPALQWPPEPGVEGMPSRVMWELLGILAEAEWAAMRERNRETQAWLSANGFLVGKAMFGYVIAPHPDNPKHKTLVPDFELRDVLLGMVDRALHGDSFTSIAAWLSAEGVPTPQGGTWSPVSVAQILRNPVLAGRRMNGRGGKGKTVLKVEPLLDAATWNALQDKVTKRTKTAPLASDAMLAGHVFCPRCDGIMHHRKITTKLASGAKSLSEYFRCDGTQTSPSTCRNMVRIDMLDAWVNDQFVSGTFGDREIIEKQVVPGMTHEDELEQLAVDLRELSELYAEDGIADDEYDVRMKALREERRRLRDLPAEPDQIQERRTGVTVAERWASLDALGRREYLREAGVTVRAMKNEMGELEAELSAEHPEVLWVSPSTRP